MRLSPNSKFSLSLKELLATLIGFTSLVGVYYTLQADITKAMELPKPEVTNVEFDYKDKLIRSTIEKTQADVTTIKEDIKEIKGTLTKLDERLYEISKNQ